MENFVRENFAHLASIIPYVVGAAGLVTLFCIWLLGRGQRFLIPKTWARRIGSLLSVWVLSVCVAVLVVAFGPMSPLVNSSLRLSHNVGKLAPDFVFRLVQDGSTHHLREFRGEVVLVNLWATWCPPCREELPALNRLQTSHNQRGLVVLTLSDEPRETLVPVLHKYSRDAYNGYVTSFEWLETSTFRPFTIIIDREGIVRDFFFGTQEYDVFERAVTKYLDAGKPSPRFN
jgi:cytochrome c biogenesis protein CcmG/thiol:disulfide interchange protein DsbE